MSMTSSLDVLHRGHGTPARAGVVAALVLGTAVLLAQEPGGRPIFRSSVELVQIDVSVLDGKRQPVKRLTAADFTILEDGVSRPVRAFNAVDLPRSDLPGRADWITAVPPDVATNDVAAEDGRLVVILMDRTIPVGQPTITANRIATSTVNALGPHDLAAVVSTSGRVPQDFTADRARLLRAINQGDASTDMSQDSKELLDQLSAQSIGQNLAPDRLSDGRCLCGLCVLDTVRQLADSLRGASARRKTVFFIGTSLIVQAPARAPSADVGCDRLLKDARQKMFDALALSSMTVHSIDPTGIVNVSPAVRASSPLRAGRVADVQQTEVNEFLGDQESLGILPQQTGGRRVINTNLPETKVADIFHESDSYYVLAFEPGRGGSAGPRSLEVKVGVKGARVYTQRRYLPPAAVAAPAAEGGRSLDSVLTGLLPVPARPLSLALSSFAASNGPAASVVVSIDAASFARAGAAVPLETAVLVLNRSGRTVASTRQAATITAAGTSSAGTAEATIQSQISLPPGDYEVRAAVRDPAQDVTASVFAQVVVPSFAAAPLSLSDILIEAAPAQAAALRRAFGHAEQVSAHLQVYQALGRTDPIVPVSVRARIVDAAGRDVRDQSVDLSASQFENRRAECRVALPLDRLATGEYLLEIDAVGGRNSATRQVRFTVR